MFETIHTTYGLAAMTQAESTGTPVNLTEMAVGDGNGSAVSPDEDQASLVRELYRAAVNRVYQDPNDQTRFTAELIIPASEGGFTLREVGIFDDQGGLFVVGNLPETYKPQMAEGAFADTVVRVEFIVSNASVVTLQVDPNVAVATQTWISNNVTAASLLPGGTTGQIPAKASNNDGDIVWQDPSVANVVVETIEELQTLADSQTTVILSTTTTFGAAVYIDGLRLVEGAGAEQWQEGANETEISLGQSYPAGTEFLVVQNDPAGSATAPLDRNNNLSDVDDTAASRGNLDVYSKAESRAAGQPGDIKYTAKNSAPTGWLKANGAAVSRTAYADLFAAIGTLYGDGDGFNTFNLPDLRGEFIRGWDDGRGIDSGRAFGSAQSDEIKSHGHAGTALSSGAHNHAGGIPYLQTYSSARFPYGLTGAARYGFTAGNYTSNAKTPNTSTDGAHSHALSITSTGGVETRPRNRAMLACIKF